MNFNRRKNIFTLGNFYSQQRDKASLNRRQNYDPFERDPFKIQSFNFRYAERPQYTNSTQIAPQRVTTSHTTVKRFDTYYYNNDFAADRRNKENPTANGFNEYRRRKYLQDQPNTTANLFSTQILTHPGGRQTPVVPTGAQNPYIGGAATSANTSAGVRAALQENDYAAVQRQLQQHRQSAIPSTTGQQYVVGSVYSAAATNGGLDLSCPYARATTSPLYNRITRHNDNSRVADYVPPLRAVPSVGSTAPASSYTNLDQQQLQQRIANHQQQQQQQHQDQSGFNYKYNVDTNRATTTATTTTEPERDREANFKNSNHTLLGRNDTRLAGGRRCFSPLYDTVTGTESVGTKDYTCSGGSKIATITTATETNNSNNTTNTTSGHINTIGGLKITVTDKNNHEYESEQVMSPAGGSTNHRRSLQTLHVTTSKDVVDGRGGKSKGKGGAGCYGGNSVESKRSNCSGCQININIKSLDDNEISENVTIKIEAADTVNGTDKKRAEQNNLMERVTSSSKVNDLNIMGCKSTDTIVIDKHISKYSIAARQLEPTENKQRNNNSLDQQRSRSSTRAAYSYAPYNAADESDSEPLMPLRRVSPKRFEPLSAPKVHQSILPVPLSIKQALSSSLVPANRVRSERVPSMVPWCLDYTPRINAAKENTHTEPRRSVNTTLRRQRALGPLLNVDLRQLKKPANSSNITPTKIPERKLLNTISKPGEVATPRKTPSHGSLRTTHHDYKMYSQPIRSSTPTRLQSHPMKSINNNNQNNSSHNNNPHKQMRSLTPCTSRELQLRRAAAPPNVSQSSNGLPLNVNINVFAEKLKLLRV